MGKYLKTRVMERLSATCATFVSLPSEMTPSSKGVRYFTTVAGIKTIRGAMDLIREGRKYHKRIIVRPSRHHPGYHELYTYHIPKAWSQACQDNRALMHEARVQAHAIERDHSLAALEWRVQQIANFYNPKDGIKPYAHLFHYVYFVLQREMRATLQNQSVEPITDQQEQPSKPESNAQTQSSEPVHYLADLPIFVSVSLPKPAVSIPIDYYKYRQLHPPRTKNANILAHMENL